MTYIRAALSFSVMALAVGIRVKYNQKRDVLETYPQRNYPHYGIQSGKDHSGDLSTTPYLKVYSTGRNTTKLMALNHEQFDIRGMHLGTYKYQDIRVCMLSPLTLPNLPANRLGWLAGYWGHVVTPRLKI